MKIEDLDENSIIKPEDITSEVMQELYEKGRLGTLRINIPHTGKVLIADKNGQNREAVDSDFTIKIDVGNLWKYSANLYSIPQEKKSNFDNSKIRPENVRAVVIYGSSLYAETEPGGREIVEESLSSKKKYIIFGPEVIRINKKVTRIPDIRNKRPKDLDIMVLTDTEISKEVYFPERTAKSEALQSNVVNDGYAVYVGERFVSEENLPIHVSYRSIEQFRYLSSKNDGPFRGVFRKGISIVGEYAFQDAIKDAQKIIVDEKIKREPMHKILWEIDKEGKLNGLIKHIREIKPEEVSSVSAV